MNLYIEQVLKNGGSHPNNCCRTRRTAKASGGLVLWKPEHADDMDARLERRGALIARRVSAIGGHRFERTERIVEVCVPRNMEMAKSGVIQLDEHRKKTKV